MGMATITMIMSTAMPAMHNFSSTVEGNSPISLRCRQNRHVGRLSKHSGRAGSAHVCQRAGTS